MQVKSKWAACIACAYIVATAAAQQGICGLITNPGPWEHGLIDEWTEERAETARQSENETALDEIKGILNSYALCNVTVKDKEFDCSNISEIIWLVLEQHGYSCDLVGNSAYVPSKDRVSRHMFVWVRLQDGVAVVEPTWEIRPTERIGLVLEDLDSTTDAFYLSGIVIDSPEEYIRIGGNRMDMIGVNKSYSIDSLPIYRREE